ncbi:unnamed protein product [Allacma fusca]|uniref:TBC1 domain family member 24 n=1 Tax=Allacma fusca TaxID=39272 RepID=A0A8J2JIX0_9HEXA|nr:unnamed protein product [Allacma fusca]
MGSLNKNKWRRPSTIFTIGEDSGDDSDQCNEFDSDEEISSVRHRRKSSTIIYSSNSSLDSDSEMAWELKERNRTRKESIAPMHSGLQTWVEIRKVEARRVSGAGDLLQIPLPVMRKKKYTYEEIKEMVINGKVKETKVAVRDSDWDVGDEMRSRLWPLLDSIHESDRSSTMVEGFYWDTVNQLFGSEELSDEEISLPCFTDPQYRLYYGLSGQGKRMSDRIVSVIGYAYPDITFCPLLLPVASLFLHYVQEEKTFNCLCTLLSARHKTFLTQTKLQWEVTYTTAMHLTKKFAKSAFMFVSRNLKSGEKVESVFQNWIWWIFRDLPLSHLVRVMDCYLMEGTKVLYRVAIALLLSFTKAAGSDSKWAHNLESSGLLASISSFIREIAITPQRLLKSAFSIRAFRGAEINKISTKIEMLLKSKGSGPSNMPRPQSFDNLPTSQSQLDIQMISHTMTIKELLTLWSWLPLRITMYQPVLLYTTEEHGCSLTTFFNRVDNHEPTILLIKTTTDEIFGAYLSSQWSTRNTRDERGERLRYFGTGETFLFSLWPERVKYPWVGIKTQEDPDRKVDHSAELFMHADSNMISIGGGEGQGVYLDEELRFGKTESCLTFNNPPLVSTRDFEVRVLEVFGFAVI